MVVTHPREGEDADALFFSIPCLVLMPTTLLCFLVVVVACGIGEYAAVFCSSAGALSLLLVFRQQVLSWFSGWEIHLQCVSVSLCERQAVMTASVLVREG